MINDQRLFEDVARHITNQDAWRFIAAFGKYIHLVDDIVDEDKDPDYIDKLTDLAPDIFTSNYWLQYGPQLRMLEKMIHLVYFITVEWEKSDESWKRRDAKALSHVGYLMLYAVLYLETSNMELVKQLAMRHMEYAHKLHMNDPINV